MAFKPGVQTDRWILFLSIVTYLVQADAVLALRLSRITALEESKLKEEKVELTQTEQTLHSTLLNDSLVFAIMRNETLLIKARHATPRRTEIILDAPEPSEEDLLKNER